MHRQQYLQRQKLLKEDQKQRKRHIASSKSGQRINSNRETFNPYHAQSIMGIFGVTCTNAKLY